MFNSPPTVLSLSGPHGNDPDHTHMESQKIMFMIFMLCAITMEVCKVAIIQVVFSFLLQCINYLFLNNFLFYHCLGSMEILMFLSKLVSVNIVFIILNISMFELLTIL